MCLNETPKALQAHVSQYNVAFHLTYNNYPNSTAKDAVCHSLEMCKNTAVTAQLLALGRQNRKM